jgi:phosphopantothenoylcysteine decarboxylase/phosphopantothenate--cysteine ligase
MRILLGITGGIAAYKAPELVRRLRQRGHAVRCVLTACGARLVAADALAAVSGQAVATTMWPGDGGIPHIDLARWAEGLLIAPLTADAAAKLAHGFADDLLATAYLALEPAKPVWLCPAMNTVMWNKPAVQANLVLLSDHGARIIGPVAGDLACGESGLGAMEAPERIAEAVG